MLFRFGPYRVDVAARRVDREGETVALEPRPFDLLVHLIRERARVVPKQELFATLWSDQSVSDSSLAQAVMKLRRAIPWPGGGEVVDTVARVGYRFGVPLDGEPALGSGHMRAAGPALTVALLPVENATGDASLAWLELGLMALAVRQLEGHGVVMPVAISSLMSALEASRTAAGLPEVAALRRATGARVVVRSRVVRERAGGLRLVYRGGGVVPFRGAVAAERPTDLAAGFADAVVQALHPGPETPAPRVPHDPLADEAFARGVQALTAHRWGQAVNLLQLALELEPDRRDAQLELLRALGNRGDDGMVPLATRLLECAGRERDAMLAARVHQALGRLHLNRGELAQGDHHLGLSLQRAGGQGGADWTARTLMLQASVANIRLEPARALQLVERMYEQCDRCGDRLLPVAGLNIEAVATATCGDFERALMLSIEAARRARNLRANAYLINACDNAAWHLARLGRLAEAAAHAEEAVAAALSFDSLGDAWSSMPTLCSVYRLAAAPQAMRQAIERMPDPADLPCPENVWRTQALLAAAEGRRAEAAELFGRALRRHREAGHCYDEEQTLPLLIDALVLSGRLDEAEAELVEAQSPRLAGSADLAAQVLHGRATLAHARGRPNEAAAWLRRLLDSPAAPLRHGFACIDLAWLEAEAGRRDVALGLLGRISPALADHPLVRAARARADATGAACPATPHLPTRL